MAADNRRRALPGKDRPTVVPPFDPGEYARSHETTRSDRIAYPASHDEIPWSSDLGEIGSVRDMLELPESRFFSRLDERVRRAELLLALLRSRGLARNTVGRALMAQLEAVRQAATELRAPQLVALLEVLGAVVGELTDISNDDTTHTMDLLVLDENEVSCDLVALAVESRGHTVRCAASFEELVTLVGERIPGLVISDAELANAPVRCLAKNIRDVIGDVPLALFTTQEGAEVERVAREVGVAWWLPKRRGVEALTSTLTNWIEYNHRKEQTSG